jgi:hypothetical protein
MLRGKAGPSNAIKELSLGPYGLASTSAGSVAQVLVEQQGHTSRCSRCSITSGVIGGISIT